MKKATLKIEFEFNSLFEPAKEPKSIQEWQDFFNEHLDFRPIIGEDESGDEDFEDSILLYQFPEITCLDVSDAEEKEMA